MVQTANFGDLDGLASFRRLDRSGLWAVHP
jgi:hypothetical protein